MKNIYKIYYIVFFLALSFSKAIAEPTLVRTKAVEAITSFFASALTFNNDGTKMYTSSMKAGETADRLYEYDLTTTYN